MPTTTRASLEEVLEFANKVREAGGGAVLDALMPARPTDPHKCLIAKNLNFACEVSGGLGSDGQTWGMILDDPKLAKQIADALELDLHAVRPNVILLPREIGAVAEAFDSLWDDDLSEIKYHYADYVWYQQNPGRWKGSEEFPASFEDYLDEVAGFIDLERIKEFWPYIEASLRESEEYGFLNERGELIL